MARGLLTLALLVPLAAGAADEVVEIIGVAPVPGLGVPREHVPANVQIFGPGAVRDRQAGSVPDLLGRSAASVNVSEVQANPLQPDLSFRGFTASPLLGTPQGLSVYLDGVRMNSPFGDTVQWDLIQQRALESITLLPGSNPLFGLNTLGGALALQTKSAERYAGAELEAAAGSFGRLEGGFEWGRRMADGAHFYAAGTLLDERGWRDFSPSDAKQLFAKLGRRDGALDLDLGLALVDSDLVGNALAPQSLLERRWQEIFTHPDQTLNRMAATTLNARYALSDEAQLAGTLYFRRVLTRTLNADVNDDFEDGPNDAAAGGSGANIGTAVENRTGTSQDAMGVALQWSFVARRHRFAAGVTHDRSSSRFDQSAQVGVFDAARGVVTTDPQVEENALHGQTRSTGVYVSDTLSPRADLHVTAAARYDYTRVRLRDVGPSAPALDGDHRFAKLNPSLGVVFEARHSLALYAGYAQGSRAPSPIELGCADPARPCTLPNALAADPPLNQVVARTFELGARGRGPRDLRWNAGVFQTDNRDDILFVGTTTSAGYFLNFGNTRRRGLEMAASGSLARLQWSASYSLVRASFESGACIVSENNSSRGTSSACSPEDSPGVFLGDDLIEVQPGDRIPGVPEHSVKVALDTPVGSRLRIGVDVQAFSRQFARGNENNRHQSGTATDLNGEARSFLGAGEVPGHAIANATARLDLGAGWGVFARVSNLFDRRYYTAGALAENPFDAAGSFVTDSGAWTRETFYSPGAPRAGWIGLRYSSR
jgi:outer membrane receptor protein involved in Fe transport